MRQIMISLVCVFLFGFQYSIIAEGLPFGSFETPVNGSTIAGSIAVTGWALDDTSVESLKIYREAGSDLIYIGDALFIEGARPDLATAYPDYPNNTKAGWGYMMLTNVLPNGGNGIFTFQAIAADGAGNRVTLGTKTVTIDNADAVKPFGAIDTPGPGGTVSGSSYKNQGWVLTPMPNSIPTGGSTINVYVDGVSLGHPTYNIYRPDIAGLFPSYTDSQGSGGSFNLDTTVYGNGLHTISWTAADDAGNIAGIGSRYFFINNQAAITVTSPNGGENWMIGSTRSITWNTGALSANIEILLSKDGGLVGTIADDHDPSTGSYSWTVGHYPGGTAATGSGYSIEIKEKGTTVSDSSDSFFSIVAETWQPPATAAQWLANPVRGAVVEIGYGGQDEYDDPPIPTVESFQTLQGLGVHVVVIEFQYGWTINPPYGPVEKQYNYLTSALDNAAAAGLYSVVGVRNGPGRNAMMPGIQETDVITTLYENTTEGNTARAAYIDMLEDIVTRFKNRPDIIAWEPIVEPALDHYMFGGEAAPYPQASAVWNPIAENFINAIRAVDANRPILIEPVNWGGPDGFTLLQKFSDNNVIYSLHTYEPYNYTHQYAAPFNYTYPGWHWGEYVDKNTLSEWLSPAENFQALHNVPILVGEWGGMRWVPAMEDYITDQLDLFETRNWSWVLYAWYDGVWDRRGFELHLGPDPNSIAYDPDNVLFAPIAAAWQQ